MWTKISKYWQYWKRLLRNFRGLSYLCMTRIITNHATEIQNFFIFHVWSLLIEMIRVACDTIVPIPNPDWYDKINNGMLLKKPFPNYLSQRMIISLLLWHRVLKVEGLTWKILLVLVKGKNISFFQQWEFDCWHFILKNIHQKGIKPFQTFFKL